MDGELEALAARQAITDLIYRYCRSVDRLDVSLGHSICHADVRAYFAALPPGLTASLEVPLSSAGGSRRHGRTHEKVATLRPTAQPS